MNPLMEGVDPSHGAERGARVGCDPFVGEDDDRQSLGQWWFRGPNLVAAVSPDDELVHVADDRAKSEPNLVCPHCRSPVYAAKGPIRTWHYRHKRGAGCADGGETAIHMLAKRALELEPWIISPPVVATGRASREMLRPSQRLDLSDIALERREAGFRPDLSASAVGHPLFIEIRVTHAVDAAKASRLAQRGVSTIEVDLSRLRWDASPDEIGRAVRELAPRAWAYSRLAAERSAAIRAAEDQDEARRSAELARQAETAVRAFRAGLRREAPTPVEADAEWRCRRLGLGPLVDPPLAADAAFTTSHRIWRSVLLDVFVVRACEDVASTGVVTGPWNASAGFYPLRAWSGHPPAAFSVKDLLDCANRHGLIKPGLGGYLKDVAPVSRAACPEFMSGYDALQSFVLHGIALGFISDGESWGEGRRYSASIVPLIGAWLDAGLSRALASIETAADVRLEPSERFRWLDRALAKMTWPDAFTKLLRDLDAIRRAFEPPFETPADLLGLRIEDAVDRARRKRDAWLRAQASERVETLRERARRVLGDRAQDWMHRRAEMLGGATPADAARGDERGLAAATASLEAFARVLASLPAIEAAAIEAFGQDGADAWLTADRGDGATVRSLLFERPDLLNLVEEELKSARVLRGKGALRQTPYSP